MRAGRHRDQHRTQLGGPILRDVVSKDGKPIPINNYSSLSGESEGVVNPGGVLICFCLLCLLVVGAVAGYFTTNFFSRKLDDPKFVAKLCPMLRCGLKYVPIERPAPKEQSALATVKVLNDRLRDIKAAREYSGFSANRHWTIAPLYPIGIGEILGNSLKSLEFLKINDCKQFFGRGVACVFDGKVKSPTNHCPFGVGNGEYFKIPRVCRERKGYIGSLASLQRLPVNPVRFVHFSNALSHGLTSFGSFLRLPPNKASGDEPDNDQKPCVEREPSLYTHILVSLLFAAIAIWGGEQIVDRNGHRRLGLAVTVIAFFGLFCTFSDFGLGGPFAFWRFRWLLGEDDYCQYQPSHNGTIVLQKYLDNFYSCSTVIDMANVLPKDKQIAVISALAEGSSIRSIERITGINRNTIMNLGVRVGRGCAALMDTSMRNLPCNRLEMDEIWGFVGKKDRNVREGEDSVGSVWTFCAIDAETKLVPAFKVGNRDVATATAFVQDVANRMAYRVQISTDGLNAYVAAMENAFGGNVDYAQIIKTYGHEEVSNNRRYSAPEFVSSEKKVVVGNPDQRLISTSYVERLNATTRLHMRRLTRLTLAFSKKRENFEAALALHFAYYNFVKRHNTLRCTPAMAAGVTGTFWSVGDLVEASA
jgi:IS1 family transposase